MESNHEIKTFNHRRTAWGVQKSRRRAQCARPAGGPPLKRLYGQILGVACPQGITGSGIAGPGGTLGHPYVRAPPPVRICYILINIVVWNFPSLFEFFVKLVFRRDQVPL
jgi:hypothetical protein